MSLTFEYCALNFLNMYIKEEKDFLVTLTPDNNNIDKAKKLETLYRISVSYSVNRFKGFNKEKMNDLFDVFDKVKLKKSNPADTVIRFSSDIAIIFNSQRNFISMSSKLLWFKFKSPVIIYDKRAKNAINFKSDNYTEFINEWRNQYLKNEAQIKLACNKVAKLDKSFLYSDFDRKILSEVWFHERVFDKYLWEVGV